MCVGDLNQGFFLLQKKLSFNNSMPFESHPGIQKPDERNLAKQSLAPHRKKSPNWEASQVGFQGLEHGLWMHGCGPRSNLQHKSQLVSGTLS
jgi:hypothetical protein